MNNYNFRYWYFYGNENDDFDEITISDLNFESAKQKVRDIRKWIFSIDLIDVNGNPVIKNECQKYIFNDGSLVV